MNINLQDSDLEDLFKHKQSPDAPGFRLISEDERLLRDAEKTGLEKLQAFTLMIRRNAMFNKAITPSKDK